MKKTSTFLMAVLLAVSLGAFTAKAQTVYPYFPSSEVAADITTVASTVANPETALLDLTGNFTVELTGTAGVEIKISNSIIFYSYTPTTSGSVRFVKKGTKVYVYEGVVYRGTIASQPCVITYPEITNETATTSPDQLLQNASFETAGTLVGGTNYNFGSPWVTNVTVASSGGIRITQATAGNVNGTWECVWRGSGNSNYFAQPVSGIKPNTSYKVIVYQLTGANANADYNVGLGSTASGTEYGMGTIRLGSTFDGIRSTTIATNLNVSGSVYFTFKNTSSNTSSSGTDPLTQIDYLALVEGTSSEASGITGGTGDVYYVGNIYTPIIAPKYSGGDYIDMTTQLANPSFEVGGLTGWTNNTMATQNNVPGQGWTKDGNVYCEKWVNQSGNLPAAGISQTVAGLPNGIYTLKAAGHAIKQGAADPTATTGAYLFAGTNQLLVNAGKEYEIRFFDKTDGDLSIGFKTEGTITSNWAAVDNFRLLYYGEDIAGPLNYLLSLRVAAAQAILDATNTPNGYNKTELQTAIAEAGSVAQTEEAINAAIAKLNAAITNYGTIVTAYATLKDALDFAVTLNSSNYPGKTTFDEAVATAQGIYNSTDDQTAQNFVNAATALKAAVQVYVLSQTLPANITPMLANPGFDVAPVTFTESNGAANGTVIAGTPGFNIPGWDEAYIGAYARVASTNYGITFTAIPDVLNGTTPPATDMAGLTNGAALKLSGSWGSTSVLTQNVTLPAGLYIFSFEAINRTAGQAIETNRFGFVPNEGTAIYGATKTFADAWTKEEVIFNLDAETAGKISIGLVGRNLGAGSNGKLYIDNVRLDYYGNAAIVAFNSNGGNSVATQYVIKGEKVATPTVPVRTGYTFLGWYIDSELTTAYDFETLVSENITLFASWEVTKSIVATLSDIKVGGTSIAAFDASTYVYDVVLPVGTTLVPEVTATTTDANAVAVVTATATLPGSTSIEVTAEDGITKLTYTVSFTVAKSTVATLSDLTVAGTTVANFSESTYLYNVELPVGTTQVPVVAATTTDANAIAVVTAATSLPGSTTVEITAEDGLTTLTYTVNFTVAKSTVATLSNLTVGGTTVANFSAATYLYDVELPVGTTQVPVVAATTTDVNAIAVVTDAATLPGSTTVEVTAEDGITKLTYTVNFTVAKSTVATLSDLTVAGTTVAAFDAQVLTYNVELPAGTVAVPVVAATATDTKASVVVTNATELPGSTTVEVTAEDGVTKQTYTIAFTVAVPTNIKPVNGQVATVYPTKSNSSFTVQFAGKPGVVTVMDVTGKVVSVQKATAKQQTIAISTSGIYLLKIESEGQTQTVKVIKTK